MNEEEIQEYVKEYLKDKKTTLNIINYNLEENTNGASISLEINNTGTPMVIAGHGVGIIDACYEALMSAFSHEYKSLNTVELTDAYFRTNIRSGSDFNSNMKSRMAINLEFKNKSKSCMSFSKKSTSVSYSAVSTLVKAFEFYINCEKLFTRLRFLVEEARERNRADVAQRYYYALSKIVEVTNYRPTS